MILASPPGAERVRLSLESLSCSADELARLQGFLTPEELQRGNRLLDKQRRDRFFAGRGILREMLAEFLSEEPEEIKLSEGEFGKPHLSDHLQPDALCFNVSHAGDLLLLAFARGCEVGVDLEQLREDLSYRTIAECYFSLREKEELFSLPSSEQISAFYRCWTRKEAYLKGTGSGFSQPSNGFDVSLLPHRPAELLTHRGSPGHPAAWSIQDVAVPEGFCAAVAFEALPSEALPCNRQELEHPEKLG